MRVRNANEMVPRSGSAWRWRVLEVQETRFVILSPARVCLWTSTTLLWSSRFCGDDRAREGGQHTKTECEYGREMLTCAFLDGQRERERDPPMIRNVTLEVTRELARLF